MTTATTSPSAVENGLAALAFSRGAFNTLLDKTPAENLLTQPFEGANHILWQAGHIAVSEDFFLQKVAGRDPICPEEWNEKFSMGSTPSAKASDYPSLSEVRAKLNETRAAFQEWYRGMSESDLDTTLSDDLKGFAPTWGALLGSTACHEGMHIGEILALRKAMNLGPAFGM